MPMRASIGNGQHLGIDSIFLQGFDEFNGFFGFCQDHPVTIFSPNLPHFHFQAEIFSFHPVFNIEGQFCGNRDILVQFLPDIFSFKIEEMRGINGKGGIPCRDLGIDQLFCPLNLRGHLPSLW